MRKRSPAITWLIYIVIIIALITTGVVYYFSRGDSKESIFKLTSSSVKDKAQKAGYEIAWIGNPKDTTGRTVFAKGKRAEEALEDKFYWTEEKNEELKLTGYIQGMGVFEKWEKITGSEDRYLVLKNPEAKTDETKYLGIRVVFDGSSIGSNAASFKPTQLSVENLDYGFKNKSTDFSTPYGYFKDIDSKTIDKIIKPGDVVAVYPIFLNEEDIKKEKSLMLTDERKLPVALTVIIRRFGGSQAVFSELSSEK